MFNCNSSPSRDEDSEAANPSITVRTGIWFLGNIAWVFGIIDRSIAIFADGCLRAVGIIQILIALFLFFGWLFLKPNTKAIKKLQKHDFWF
jgi:hypothetical protein